jgi:hypothetical protein
MLKRIIILYGVLGPVAGATLYVALSALASILHVRPDIFLDPRFFGTTLLANLDLVTWQIAVSAPVTLLPAVITGWMTVQRLERYGNCPWWLSCGYGGVFSGGLAIIGLSLGHLTMPHMTSIPPIIGGSALIALIGFVGTWPCWRLATAAFPAYRNSPQNL